MSSEAGYSFSFTLLEIIHETEPLNFDYLASHDCLEFLLFDA